MTVWKMHDLENAGMENTHHAKPQKMHRLENERKYTTGKCQNGKYTT